VQDLAVLLGARLGAAWRNVSLRQPAAVVPVPLHWIRHRSRGFNQAERIAFGFSRASGLPVIPALRRVRSTRAQSGVPSDSRRVNVKGAFEAVRPIPDRVILVDDIATSGATLETSAAVLRNAGASWVEAAVVATELPKRD
jgi:ComF family protein